MPSDPQNHGAEEQRLYQKAAEKADAAFAKAMRAAGYELVTITTPQTSQVHITRGEPLAITRGGSPASDCADLGGNGGRGPHFYR